MSKVKPIIIIAGMHRSGTSVVSRLLNLLGMGVGENLVPADENENSEGYWEDKRIVQYHEAIHHGCFHMRSDDIALFEANWQDRHDVEFLAPQLEAVIAEGIKENKLWGVKDPRVCRLLPAWQPVMKSLNVKPHYVIPFRHPAEVVASLQKRHPGLYSDDHRYWWWLLHVLDAEKFTRGSPRVAVNYHTVLKDWQGSMQAVQKALHVPWEHEPKDIKKEVGQFIKPHMKHHSKNKIAPESGVLKDYVEAVYDLLEKSDLQDIKEAKSWDAIRNEVYSLLEPWNKRMNYWRVKTYRRSAALVDTNARLMHARECHQTILNSTVWRLTGPLRNIGNWLKTILNRF